VPRIQKEIARRAGIARIPVILATQVLESMITEPRPTRAEVTDAAHAVDEGVDAIMLAGETAVGHHAVRAVQTLDAIIRDAEVMAPFMTASPDVSEETADHAQALCDAAVTLATSSGADAIVAVTRAGTTARMLSSLRPRAPIIAVTEVDSLARRLSPLWGVQPIVARRPDDIDAWGTGYGRLLREGGWLKKGAAVVFISVSTDASQPDGNFLKFQRLD
jgi:pyruvate kinase